MARRLAVQAPQWTTAAYPETSSGKSWPWTVSTSSLPPTYWLSHRGIFTRPMSSAMGWWLHDSAMRMRSPGRRFSKANAPST